MNVCILMGWGKFVNAKSHHIDAFKALLEMGLCKFQCISVDDKRPDCVQGALLHEYMQIKVSTIC